MNQSNKKVAIVLAGDEKLDFAIANVIIGLKRYNESLIDRVFVYTDMPQEKQDKISLIWRDKIAFVAFSYEDFEREFSNATNEKIPKCIAQDKRFLHHIYAKFHCFDILEDYDYVIWLDSDVLVQNSIEEILAVETDFKWGNGQRKQIESYLRNFAEIGGQEQKIAKPNGGVISLSKNILGKTSIPLRLECYKVVSRCYSLGVLSEVALSDEIPFGVLSFKYHLSFAPLRVANIAPYSPHCSKDVAIIHAVSASKFWSSAFSSLLFGEWYVNHKEWERISQEKRDFEYKKSNLSIENIGKLYEFLLALHYLKPLILRLEKTIFGDSASFYVAPLLGCTIEIYSHLLGREIFYRFTYQHYYGEWDISCELQLVAQGERVKSDVFLRCLQGIANNARYKLRLSKDENNQTIAVLLCKNVNLKNIEECIQEFLFLKSVSFAPIYQYSLKENGKLSGYETFFTATSRVQSHLSYQLGQILIQDSKSLSRISKLPFKILLTMLKHRNKQKQYQEKLAKNPHLKLPPLESYPDYKQALKIKNYFSYQLGEAFLTSISAGGGGISHLYTQSA